ncbi:MAG: hypothetical protein O210_OD1C00001G0723, partial [Parcubacteria bacterium RAAC4_OD1_1]
MVLNIFKKKNTAIHNNKLYYCPFCDKNTIFNDFGDPKRKNVVCSICGSLERHRFLFFIYKVMFLGSKSNINLLHMAPEKCLFDLFKNFNNINYVAADLNPNNFPFV